LLGLCSLARQFLLVNNRTACPHPLLFAGQVLKANTSPLCLTGALLFLIVGPFHGSDGIWSWRDKDRFKNGML